MSHNTKKKPTLMGAAALAALIIMGGTVSGCEVPADTPVPASTKAGEKKSAAKAEKQGSGLGDEARDGKFAFTVTKIKKGIAKVGNEFLNSKAQGQYVLVYVTVKNIGDEARTFDATPQTLFDTAGREFKADVEAGITMGDANSFLKDINPGNQLKGVLVFDVPKSFTAKSIQLHDSLFSGGVSVTLVG